MARRGAEVPHDRLALLAIALREQAEASGLVECPGADVGRREVPDVVEVEAQQRAHLRLSQRLLGALQPLPAEPVEVDARLPVHTHRPEGLRHPAHSLPPTRSRALCATDSGVGTVWSSSTGENGTGTSIAPRRWTGASRW